MVVILNARASSAARDPRTRSKVSALFGAAGAYPRIIVAEGKDVQAIARQAVAANERTIDLRITVDGKQLLRRTPFIFIGNNEYEMTGFRFGHRTRLNAGTLSVLLTHHMGWPGLLELSVEALFRRLKHGKNFEVYCVEEICIEARRRRLLVATDGEVRWMKSPLRYRVRPNALRVVVPQDGAG